MLQTAKRLAIGVSAIVGVSAIAIGPASAFTFSGTNYRTYTGGNSGSFVAGDSAAAINALTDGDPTSNVELWYTNENPTAYTSFSTVVGGKNVTVSNITKADWAGGLADMWLTDLLAANSEVNTAWNAQTAQNRAAAVLSLRTNGLPSSNDPNIGGFRFDGSTGNLSLDIVGHFDLRSRLTSTNTAQRYSTGNLVWDTILRSTVGGFTNPLQMSEIARVVVDNEVHYAYSFLATNTGITASDDRESYNGLYTWTKKIADPVTPPPADVPEPSALLGLAAVGGLFAAKRKFKNA